MSAMGVRAPDGRVVGRYSSIVGKKTSQAGEDALAGLACVRELQFFCSLRQRRPFPSFIWRAGAVSLVLLSS
jgi:hypothetical protein